MEVAHQIEEQQKWGGRRNGMKGECNEVKDEGKGLIEVNDEMKLKWR